MECLLALCLTLYGGLGIQSGYELVHDTEMNVYKYTQPSELTNSYGMFIGEINVEARLENIIYLKLFHLSGINESEIDYGFNSIVMGANIPLGNFEFGVGMGYQLKNDNPSTHSNTYNSDYLEAYASYWFNNGMYLSAKQVAGMQYFSIGLSAKFF